MNKLRFLYLGIFALIASVGFAALPTHDKCIATGTPSLSTNYSAWTPGSPYPDSSVQEDENFFISRVKMKARFTNQSTQVNTSLNPNRKLMWWCPIGSAGWTSLPNYQFNYDAFSSWSYIDNYGNWTEGFLRHPGGFADVCHKNGVTSAVVSQPAYGANLASDGNGAIYAKLISGGADKLLKLMKYYGIDGIGFNSECNFNVNVGGYNMATGLQGLFANMHAKKASYGMDHLHIDWYDGVGNTGSGPSFAEQLYSGNVSWFHNGTNYVCNNFFLNYNVTTSGMSTSVATATNKTGDANSSWNVYVGMDMQGRSIARWPDLANYNLSIGIWGAHDTNMIYIGIGEDGSDAETCQQVHLRRQEYVFTGGTRNPVNTPAISTLLTNGNKKTGPQFHGISKIMPAKSTLQELPFITYFNMGNGKNLKQQGQVTFPNGWYNIGMQDYLPTWRWWITTSFMGRNLTDVPATDFNVGFSYNDSWNGGSSLKVSGAATTAYAQLFKTNINLPSDGYKLNIRYKVLSGTADKMSWACSTTDAPSTEKSKQIKTSLSASGNWEYFTLNIKSSGFTGVWKEVANKTLAMIGLKFENTSSDFEMLIGEISILPTTNTTTPETPVIDASKTKVLKSYYNGVDYKIIFNCNTPAGHPHLTNAWEPVYNEDVNVWYFNIWFKQGIDGEPVLCTQTTSWASYVIGAPADLVNGASDVYFGVSAVSIDGQTESNIAWQKYTIKSTDLTVLNDIEIDKPVIKSNEDFRIYFVDPTHATANWVITESATGTQVASGVGVKELNLKLQNEGSYDVRVNGVMTPGLIQISPASVGAMPEIKTLQADDSQLKQSTPGKETFTTAVRYTSRDADGTVSKGLRVQDPNAFVARVNDVNNATTTEIAKRAPYSYALWFKALAVNHDTQGTNLIYKTDINCDWPQNNWGEFWVQIRPEGVTKNTTGGGTCYSGSCSTKCVANEISFNVTGWSAHDNARYGATAEGYPLVVGTWYHLVVTLDAKSGSYNEEKIYINGKLVSKSNNSTVFDNGCQSAFNTNSYAFNRSRVRLYVGAGGVYKAGFNGIIDEVQCWDKVLTDAEVLQCMRGYSKGNVPANLKGYWTFDETEFKTIDGARYEVFPNWGTGGDYCFGYYSSPVIQENANDAGSLTEKFLGDNPEAGCPMIAGSYIVETTPEWSYVGGSGTLQGSTYNTTSGSVNVSNTQVVNPFRVYLTLKNSWGKSSQEYADIEVYDHTVGVSLLEQVNDLSIYPNPFTERVSMRFPQAGLYTFDVINMQGAVISSQSQEISAGETVLVNVNGEAGTYLIRVKNADNIVIKTVKVIKN